MSKPDQRLIWVALRPAGAVRYLPAKRFTVEKMGRGWWLFKKNQTA
jgi:hypothetical protein